MAIKIDSKKKKEKDIYYIPFQMHITLKPFFFLAVRFGKKVK